MSYSYRAVLLLQIGGCPIGKDNVYYVRIFRSISRASDDESCSPQLVNVSLNDTSDFDLTTHQRIAIFGAILASASIITLLKELFGMITCLNASRILHNKMLSAILQAPILFFDTNPVGEYQQCSHVYP